MARHRSSHFALETLEGRSIPSVMTVTNPAEYDTYGTEQPAPPSYTTPPTAFPTYPTSPTRPA